MTARTLVKFCGLVSATDVDAAVAAGADALGFVLCRSGRRVRPQDLAELLARIPRGRLKLAVMGPPDPALIELVNSLPFDALQCECNDIDLRSRSGLPQLDGARFLLASFRDSEEVLQHIEAYRALERPRRSASPFEAAVLLDGPAGGGRGIPPDEQRARTLARSGALILAGGLGPENVQERVSAVQPVGVDVSSGIEFSPGHKDPERMRRFVARLRPQNNRAQTLKTTRVIP